MDKIKVNSDIIDSIPILFEFNSGTEHFNLSTASSGLADLPVYSWVDDRGLIDTGDPYVYNNAAVFKLTREQVISGEILIECTPANTDINERYCFNVGSLLSDGFNIDFNKYIGNTKSDNLQQDGNIMGNLWDAEKYKGVLYAVRLNDTTHDLTGIAFLYHRCDVDRMAYGGLDAASLTFVQQRLANDGKQYFIIGDTDYDPSIYGPESTPQGYGDKDPVNPTGGKPALDHTSDTIGIPDRPLVGVTTAGFYHAYKVSQGLLNNFGAKLFPSMSVIFSNVTGISSTEDVLKLLEQFLFSPGAFYNTDVVTQNFSVIDMLVNGKAIDYVVDCHIIPVAPAISGSANIKCGAREIDVAAPVITDDYIDFDCGSVSIPAQFQNFLDVTQCRGRLFLPFVGFVDIKPEFWHGGTLSVKYRFNIVDGSFMAYVSSTSAYSHLVNTVVGQYGGCACLHIPVTGVNYASMISGLVTGSMSLAANAAAGKTVGMASSAMSVLNMKPEVAMSNNYNSSTAFLGVRRPYLLIERCVPCMSERYVHEHGIPLNVYTTLGAMSGYTEVDPNIDLSGIQAPVEVLEDVRQALVEGCIF